MRLCAGRALPGRRDQGRPESAACFRTSPLLYLLVYRHLGNVRFLPVFSSLPSPFLREIEHERCIGVYETSPILSGASPSVRCLSGAAECTPDHLKSFLFSSRSVLRRSYSSRCCWIFQPVLISSLHLRLTLELPEFPGGPLSFHLLLAFFLGLAHQVLN